MAEIGRAGRHLPSGLPQALPGHPLTDLSESALVERLVTATPDQLPPLEAELRRRAAHPHQHASLRRLLLTRAQDADEYLGASAEAARHYLSLLDTLHKT